MSQVVSARTLDGFERFKQTGRLESSNARRLELEEGTSTSRKAILDTFAIAIENDNGFVDMDPRVGHVHMKETLQASFTDQRAELKLLFDPLHSEQVLEVSDQGMIMYQLTPQNGGPAISAYSFPSAGHGVLFTEKLPVE